MPKLQAKDTWRLGLKSFFFKALEDTRKLKKYFVLITTVFAISIVLGIIFEPTKGAWFMDLLEGILAELAQREGVGILLFIIGNNLRSAFLGMLLGTFFGIFPLFAASINGLILGGIMRMAAEEDIFSLWKVLPHGIFELPAILLAFSLGFKIGIELFTKRPLEKLKQNYISAFRVFVAIVLPLIILAGIIEGILIIAVS